MSSKLCQKEKLLEKRDANSFAYTDILLPLWNELARPLK